MQMEFNDDGSLKVKEKVPKKLLSQPHIKVLKLIKELSFPVGRKLMAEVLRGEENTRIKQFKLNYKNNFGTLGLYDTKDVYELLDTMLSKNLIEIIKSGVNFYPVIKMTPKGQQQLENPTDIEEQYCIEQDNLCQITEDDKK
ncbi:MAG: hypothetical protein KKA79_00770, partial [Nanoarchaeota archaeon]|nr:hypothetical protein [Nanoarchaeota archaeon]